MALIEQRHPAFGGLMRLWLASASEGRLPQARSLGRSELADLASLTVTLALDPSGDALVIAESGGAVDALYGVALTGSPAARLSPESDDAEREARVAIATRRPLLIEDELRGGEQRRRIARLYLPLGKDDGSPDGVLCGIVAVV